MFGIDNIIPFQSEFLLLGIIVMFFSLSLLSVVMALNIILKRYISIGIKNPYLDEDKIDLKRSDEAIRKTLTGFFLGQMLYIFMFIIQ